MSTDLDLTIWHFLSGTQGWPNRQMAREFPFWLLEFHSSQQRSSSPWTSWTGFQFFIYAGMSGHVLFDHKKCQFWGCLKICTGKIQALWEFSPINIIKMMYNWHLPQYLQASRIPSFINIINIYIYIPSLASLASSAPAPAPASSSSSSSSSSSWAASSSSSSWSWSWSWAAASSSSSSSSSS